MYSKKDIENMLKNYLKNRAKLEELENKIEKNNILLKYNGTQIVQTDKETIEEMSLHSPIIDSQPKSKGKSDPTAKTALTYQQYLVQTNIIDKEKIKIENAEFYEKMYPLQEVVNRVELMISALSDEQRLVIKSYYMNGLKWDYVADVYYDVYKEPRSISRLQGIRNKALELMIDIINN